MRPWQGLQATKKRLLLVLLRLKRQWSGTSVVLKKAGKVVRLFKAEGNRNLFNAAAAAQHGFGRFNQLRANELAKRNV